MKKAIKATFGMMFVMLASLAVGCGQGPTEASIGTTAQPLAYDTSDNPPTYTIDDSTYVTDGSGDTTARTAPRQSCLDLMDQVASVPPGTSCTCGSGAVAYCGNRTRNCASSSLDTACCMNSPSTC